MSTEQTGFPRRNKLDDFWPAERAIWDAQQAVEALAPDVRLSEAGNLLAKARDLVADYVDGVPAPTATEPTAPACTMDGCDHAGDPATCGTCHGGDDAVRAVLTTPFAPRAGAAGEVERMPDRYRLKALMAEGMCREDAQQVEAFARQLEDLSTTPRNKAEPTAPALVDANPLERAAATVWDVADELGELQAVFDRWLAEGGTGPDEFGDDGGIFLNLSERLRGCAIRVPAAAAPAPAVLTVARQDEKWMRGICEELGVQIEFNPLQRGLRAAEGWRPTLREYVEGLRARIAELEGAAPAPVVLAEGERERRVAQVEHWKGVAELNDGEAQRSAAEVNELRAELAAVLDRDVCARERDRYFRWYQEAEDKAQQDRLRLAEALAEMEGRWRRAEALAARLDQELFKFALSDATGTPRPRGLPEVQTPLDGD